MSRADTGSTGIEVNIQLVVPVEDGETVDLLLSREEAEELYLALCHTLHKPTFQAPSKGDNWPEQSMKGEAVVR